MLKTKQSYALIWSVVLLLTHGCQLPSSDNIKGRDAGPSDSKANKEASSGDLDNDQGQPTDLAAKDLGPDLLCPGDTDCDGELDETDCEPENPEVHREQTESCNGIDDDCDGETDEPQAEGCKTYYLDNDGDTHGDPDQSACLCHPLQAFDVTVGDDCYDDRFEAKPAQTGWFDEHRGDGSFDYDCDDKETRRYPFEGACIWDASNKSCKLVEGFFKSVPPCGDAGELVAGCTPDTGSSCAPNLTKTIQACR